MRAMLLSSLLFLVNACITAGNPRLIKPILIGYWPIYKTKFQLMGIAAKIRIDARSPIDAKPYAELELLDSSQNEVDGYWFNGSQSCMQKALHIRNNGYKGLMIWELGIDRSDSLSLTKSVSRTLNTN